MFPLHRRPRPRRQLHHDQSLMLSLALLLHFLRHDQELRHYQQWIEQGDAEFELVVPGACGLASGFAQLQRASRGASR